MYKMSKTKRVVATILNVNLNCVSSYPSGYGYTTTEIKVKQVAYNVRKTCCTMVHIKCEACSDDKNQTKVHLNVWKVKF